MKIAKIADIENLADGAVIGEMTLTIKKVFETKRGKGKFGDWSVTSAIVTDGTGEVRCSFWGIDISDLQNQTITIRSTPTKKGLQGLSVKFSSHSNKNELSVSDRASINDQATTKVAEFKNGEIQRSAALGALSKVEARKAIFLNAQLYVECLKAANWIKEQIEISADHLQAATASMYISAERAGLAKAFVEEPKPVAAVVEEKPADEPEDDSDEIGW